MRREMLVRDLRVIVDGDKVEVRRDRRVIGLGRFRDGSLIVYVEMANVPLGTVDAIEEALREAEREPTNCA